MELYDQADALRTRMRGGSVLDAAGAEVWRSPDRSFSGGRLDNGDVELFRDDLVRLLYEATRDKMQYLWNDSVRAWAERPSGLRVEFDRSAVREFDFVVGANELHSNVRRLVFGEESSCVRSLGIGLAIVSAPNFLDLRDCQLSYREASRGYLIYATRDNAQLRVNLGVALESPEVWRRSADAQKRLIADHYSTMQWKMPQLIDAMWTSQEFYFGEVAPVRMNTWWRGRAALLGGAAFCPSPFSVQGTSLALVGAFLLARELARTPHDSSAAFMRYQSRMAPFVTLDQALVDSARIGPIPDDALDRAKRGKVLDDLPQPVSRN